MCYSRRQDPCAAFGFPNTFIRVYFVQKLIQKLVEWISRVVLTLIHTQRKGTHRLSAFANSVAFHYNFSLFFCFFGGRVWLTSPLPFPLSSFPLLFLFSDRSAPLINGALSHFLPDTFFFLRVLFWPPSISFFTGQIDLWKERDWLLFVCSFVPPHCVLKGLTHTRQN